MIRFAALSKVQRTEIMRYLAEHPECLGDEEYSHDSVTFEATFPESLFSSIVRIAEEEKVHSPPHSPTANHRDTVASQPADQQKPLGWLVKLIDEFYDYRHKLFLLEDAQGQRDNSPIGGKTPRSRPQRRLHRSVVDDVSVHTYHFLSKRFGVAGLVKRAGEQLMASVKVHRHSDLGVALYSALLSSSCYDTDDVRFVLACRQTLKPFCHLKQSRCGNFVVPKEYVPLCAIPSLLRKCLKPRFLSTLRRIQSALTSWCDSAFRFPSISTDLNFYAPPFQFSNPYVGKDAPMREEYPEDRFVAADSGLVVEASQVLLLLLLNFKQERICPGRNFASPTPTKRTSSTPHRPRDPSGICAPTLCSMAHASERPPLTPVGTNTAPNPPARSRSSVQGSVKAARKAPSVSIAVPSQLSVESDASTPTSPLFDWVMPSNIAQSTSASKKPKQEPESKLAPVPLPVPMEAALFVQSFCEERVLGESQPQPELEASFSPRGQSVEQTDDLMSDVRALEHRLLSVVKSFRSSYCPD